MRRSLQAIHSEVDVEVPPDLAGADRMVLIRVFCTFHGDRIVLLYAAARVFQLEMTTRAELGEQLHAARTAKALSQPALSAVTGIQQSEISRIESGAANPTVATISKIADALGLKLSLTPQHEPAAFIERCEVSGAPWLTDLLGRAASRVVAPAGFSVNRRSASPAAGMSI